MKLLGIQPVTTPVRSQQNNGMAKSFIKMIKGGCVA
ncbi:hypothetical protein ALO45_102276 [Pseudomonas syringae pv. syringae]|nr:hypothetical protein ALO45_102276 [Pseudomonas syringae pv. syringae]